MKLDIVLGGVGGQGILSIAFVLDNAAMKQGLRVKQSEVHGMAQRGGAVSSFLRISKEEIFSDVIPLGGADMLLCVEPMEALRYLELLSSDGWVVASTSPEVNIPDYPELDAVLDALVRLPRVILLNGVKVAKEAGSHRAQNMVVLGAASPHLPLDPEQLEQLIGVLFGAKGEKVVRANHNAFRYGRATGQFFRRCLELGAEPRAVLALMDHLESASLDPAAAEPWCRALAGPLAAELAGLWRAEPGRSLSGSPSIPEGLLAQGIGFLAATRA
jgi:indolepyruvate ferredoxin oxidoreductase beta subunit